MNNMNVAVEIFHSQDAAGEIVLSVDFDYRKGSPAHMGSMNYPGHPAEGPEIELETIFWPIDRWDVDKGKRVADHIEMPPSGIPLNVLEAIETFIIENYDPTDDGPDY